jgi:lysophospholipase L1-like esterase
VTGRAVDDVARDYSRLIDAVARAAPRARILVHSVPPVRATPDNEDLPDAAAIRALNERLGALAAQKGISFVDLGPALSEPGGALDARYSRDGVHLTGAGYLRWSEALAPLLPPH